MPLLDKFATFVVKRKLEKSGQLEALECAYDEHVAMKNNGQQNSYRDFENLFWDITTSLHPHPKEQKKFFFDFQFILLSSIWSSLSREDAENIKLIAMDFYRLRMSVIKARVELFRKNLPHFNLNEEDKAQISDYIELLDDTHKIFVDSKDYTFTEAISMMPESLHYPENLALNILEYLGYKRETVARNF